MMRLRRIFTSRSAYYRLLAIAGVFTIILYWFLENRHAVLYGPLQSKTPLNHEELNQVFTLYHSRHPRLQKHKTRSSVYDEVFDSISKYDFLKSSSFEDRCLVYFNHLSKSNPEWTINPDEQVKYDGEAFDSFEKYKKNKYNDYKHKLAEAEELNEELPEWNEEKINKDYAELWKQVHEQEQKLHDYLAHVRIFDKCYIQSQDATIRKKDTSYVKKQRFFLRNMVSYTPDPNEVQDGLIHKLKMSCAEIEAKVFPWLTFEYPMFTRYSGETAYFPGSDYRVHENKGCFLNEFKERLNGKGLVLTINDGMVDDTIRLIRILRFLGNRYPIEIIYHSRLTELSRQHLVRAARIKYENYPTQDLWFVDVSRSIEPAVIGKFSSFANKIIATLFNSFEEMILIDADTVLMQPPEYFFKLKKYIDSGTMFYKDRTAYNTREEDHMFMFEKLMPSLEDSMVFNVNQIGNHTLNHVFFHGFEHLMESGLVVINRKKHFIQPYLMAILNFYHPITSRLYGDKELFWLALVIAGDENYQFNDNFAAAIGQLTPETERHKEVGQIKSFLSQELCSSHPSHISDIDNQTLVWFNSGFRFCGNSKRGMDFEHEFEMQNRFTKLKTVEEFRTFFSSQMKITHAVIPPFDMNRKMAVNIEHEPEAAWTMTSYCKNYLWCAYSTVGGYYEENGETKSNLIKGKVVEFTPEQIKSFDAIGDVWMKDTQLMELS